MKMSSVRGTQNDSQPANKIIMYPPPLRSSISPVYVRISSHTIVCRRCLSHQGAPYHYQIEEGTVEENDVGGVC